MTQTLVKKFIENANKISNLKDLVNKIKTSGKIEQFDGEKFIKEYDNYSPRVRKDLLGKNDALWEALREKACELLYEGEGKFSSILKASVGTTCTDLKATLVQFSLLRGQIFDFQFNVLEALARVVRGVVAKKLAQKIPKSANNLLEGSQLMLGFFMTHYRLQSHAALYCDQLEYLNFGQPIGLSACSSTAGGFVSSSELNILKAYSLPHSLVTHLENKYVYISTRPQFSNDTGFIDLRSLAKGKSVVFSFPANKTWLRQYNWVSRTDRLVPFVQSFKLYLPLKVYKTGREKTYSKTTIHLTSMAPSSFKKSGVLYDLPDRKYVTKYSEGYNRCAGEEISNPYSAGKKICDTTTGISIPGKSILPTILSTWRLNYTKESGNRILKWDAPNSAPNLLITGKVKLIFLSNRNRKRALTSGCCADDNKNKPEWNNKSCVPCSSVNSTDSTSILAGSATKAKFRKGNQAPN